MKKLIQQLVERERKILKKQKVSKDEFYTFLGKPDLHKNKYRKRATRVIG